MKVFIWSPFISGDVGTVWTVLNTAKCLNKFSKEKYKVSVINIAYEWEKFKDYFINNNLKKINLDIGLNFKNLPKGSFFKSRFTYVLVSILSIGKLHNLLKNEKPDFLMVHLLTFTPLILMLLFNYKTKFILRISGYPKLNFLRSLFWKLCRKKIHKILCPTEETKKYLIKKKIFKEKKLFVINEPIIDLETVRLKKRKKGSIDLKRFGKYVVSIGRLTKQKNFEFLIRCFDKILDSEPDLSLLICGDGEEKNKLNELIIKLKRENRIFLLGFCENIFPILNNSLFFTLTSDWEDPGFVIIESMFFNKIVISSNCKSGPTEIIDDFKNGFLFEKRDEKNFLKVFFYLYNLIKTNDNVIKKIKLNAKKTTKKFSLYNYFKILDATLT